jgi:hypothetical protein
MPIFKLILIDQQFEGARIVLRELADLSPVQTALQQIEREIPLSQVANTLRENLLPFYQQQDQRIQQLQLQLRLQTEERQRLENQLESWYLNPLQDQITAAKQAAEQSSCSQQKAEESLLSIKKILEREQPTHAQIVQSLNNEIKALNRLVASQHKRLEDLTGFDTPE